MSETTVIAAPRRAQALYVLALAFAALAVASNYNPETERLPTFEWGLIIAGLIGLEACTVASARSLPAFTRRRRWGAALFALVAGFASLSTSVSKSLDFAWRTQVTQEENRLHLARVYETEWAAFRAKQSELESQLAAAGVARTPADVLEALRECERNGCRKVRVEQLRAEMGVAEKRAGIHDEIKRLQPPTAAPVARASGFGDFMHELFGLNPKKSDMFAAWLLVLGIQLPAPLAALAASLDRAPPKEQRKAPAIKLKEEQRPDAVRRDVADGERVVYLIHAEGTDLYKIGVTAAGKTVRRAQVLQTGCPYALRMVDTIAGDEGLERALHAYFDPLSIRGEWFKDETGVISAWFAAQPLCAGDTEPESEPAQQSDDHDPPAAPPVAAQQGSVPSVPRARRPLKLISARAERVVQMVQEAGGRLQAGSRALAAQLEVHPVTLGHAIKEAVEAGVLLHEATRRHTTLQLA
jgi:hypothetical protein